MVNVARNRRQSPRDAPLKKTVPQLIRMPVSDWAHCHRQASVALLSSELLIRRSLPAKSVFAVDPRTCLGRVTELSS